MQSNSVLPANPQPSTEPISLNSVDNPRVNHVNEQDLVMEDLEKVSESSMGGGSL